MESLVRKINGELKVSHIVIAENTDNKQKSIKDLIARNLSDFQEFGEVEVIETKIQTAGGVQLQNTYWLNEQQYSLLMTFLRNNEVVKKFKINMVKAFFMMKEKLENPNIQELSGRVGGLTKSNNDLRRELDKYKKKAKRRFENLEDDVDELKSKTIYITNKNYDEKMDILFKQSEQLMNVKGEFTRCTLIETLQKHNRFYRDYIDILKSDGNTLQKWATNEIDKLKTERNNSELELFHLKYRFEKNLKKIADLQNLAKIIVDFDIEEQMKFAIID